MSIRTENMVSPDIYWDSGHIRGRCSVCYDTKQHRSKRQPKYWKPYYFRVVEKVNWFRGDDEYLGMICKQCIKDGRVAQVNKITTQQIKELEA